MEGRPPNEQELIARSRAGDTRAFDELVRLHQGLALRVAFLVVRERSEAEDVTQEAFVKAFRSIGRFEVNSPFRPWLMRIVRNEALNRVRGTARRERFARRLMNDPGSGGAAPSPESLVVNDLERRRVLSAMEALPGKYRSVVFHRYLLDMSEREVATVLHIPIGTVKSRTARGLALLRSVLEKEIQEGGES